MPGFTARATAFAALGLMLIPGCSGRTDSRAVSAADLQKSLVDQLARAGTPSTWVNCTKDLPGRVGAMTRCDVKFRSDNTVTALLTTTQINGDKVTWEVTGPELTKDQVAERVAGMTSAQSATCDSGLDGRPGDWVQCQVATGDVTLNQTVEIKGAKGLSLELALTPAIPKQQTEDLLRNRLAAKYSLPFESATCPGDLVGVTGTTMDCVATSGGGQETYTLIVTDTDTGNGAVNFEVADRPAPLPVQAAPAPPPVEAAPAPPPVEAAPAPGPFEAAPEPEPVQSAPVTKPAPSKVVPQPAPVEGVPQLPPVVPHLPPGGPVPAPGPVAPEADLAQVITQTAGG